VSDEKNEPPTRKKLKQAREKGQVAFSRDIVKLAMLTVVLEMALTTEHLWRQSISSMMILSVTSVGVPFDKVMNEMINSAGTILLLAFGTFSLVCVSVATAACWGQFGVLFVTESLTPKLDKLNPVNGIKQLFQLKKFLELLISIVKTTLIGLTMYILIKDQLPYIVLLSDGEPKEIYQGFITMLRSTFHVVLIVCAFLSLVDFAIKKYFHSKELRMDMEEIKREYKETEGDPLIKGKRKQLARQLANQPPVKRTEEANAVVINPTHFAVAMLYDPNTTQVPVVLAKGRDDVAHAMIMRAKECGIPVIRHVWLARTLFSTCKIDTVVPKSSYEAVAHVYAMVHELQITNQLDKVVELESYGEPPSSSLNG
jgi:type III secretion protein U